MNSQKIKEIIKELREYNKNNTDKTVEERLLILKDEYSDFSDNYPRLFEEIVEDSLDDTILNRLLNIMKMKESQTISNHQADVDVGQILVNKYVKQDSST